MFCKQCGTQLPDDAKFCTSCGADLGGSQALTQPQAQTGPQGAPKPQFTPQPSIAGALDTTAAKKKSTGLMAAIVVVIVIALIVGIIIGSGALKGGSDSPLTQEQELLPGLYELTTSYEGIEFELFSAYVDDEMNIAVKVDQNSYERSAFTELPDLVPGCRVFEGTIGSDEYAQTMVLQVPDGIYDGHFDGTWYVSITDASGDVYGAGVFLNDDGTGLAFLLDTGNGVPYLADADEAYGLMDQQQFPITWRQTSPNSFEGSFEYYDNIIDFEVEIPEGE